QQKYISYSVTSNSTLPMFSYSTVYLPISSSTGILKVPAETNRPAFSVLLLSDSALASHFTAFAGWPRTSVDFPSLMTSPLNDNVPLMSSSSSYSNFLGSPKITAPVTAPSETTSYRSMFGNQSSYRPSGISAPAATLHFLIMSSSSSSGNTISSTMNTSSISRSGILKSLSDTFSRIVRSVIAPYSGWSLLNSSCVSSLVRLIL